MPPLCSPQKNQDTELSNKNNSETADTDYGLITPPLNTIHRNEDVRVINLIQGVPQIDQLFEIHEHIGEGTFSYVFLADLRTDPTKTRKFALKHLIPTGSPERAMFELKCLQQMGGKDNIASVELCLRNEGNIVFVMPYMRHDQFQQYVSSMDAKELAFYMKNLMLALARVHSFGIIHRDIKPSNFLYDRKNKKFMLVDFGLAQMERSSKKHDICVKRKRENSPENMTLDTIRHVSKKSQLQTIPQNATVTSESLAKERSRCEQNEKENKPVGINLLGILKSPFKSPLKSNTVNIQLPRKSPFKFAGLDLPLNHSTVGKRRLFGDDADGLSFQKPQSIQPPSISNSTIPATQQSTMRTHGQTSKTKSPKNLMVFTTPLNHTKNQQRSSSKAQQHKCNCYGKPIVCNVCLCRKSLMAARAGTPGFRPPEVLLKSHEQSTAIDIWAAGIMMTCILSGCYPFFQAIDDYYALAEIITLFGDQSVKRVAHQLGRHIICSERKQPLDLRKVCCRLRQNLDKSSRKENDRKSMEMCTPCMQSRDNCLCLNVPMTGVHDTYPDEAYHLLSQLLDINPKTRMTAAQALEHPFLKSVP